MRLSVLTAAVPLVLGLCAAPAEAAFPGRPGLIAYSCPDRPGTFPNQICTIRPDGTGRRQLTHYTAGYAWEPSWSPDGKRIAFTRVNADSQRDVHVMNADGSGKARVTTSPYPEDSPAWSPDGTRIAFVSHRGSFGNIYTLRSTAPYGSAQRLTDVQLDVGASGVYFDDLDWSPDGLSIIAARWDESPTSTSTTFLYEVSTVDGTSRRFPARGPAKSDLSPDYSPRGRALVWSSVDRYEPRTGVLYQSAPDGSGTRALTSHSDGVLRLDPAWSPDGRRIVYGAEGPAGTPFAGGGIAVMRSDGTGERLVTLDGAEPDWQPLAG